MRSLSFYLSLCLVAANQHRELPAAYRPLGKVYGEVGRAATHRRIRFDVSRPDDYYYLRQVDNCIFPLEIVLVQDLSDSFNENVQEMRDTQLKLMYETLSKRHPNSSYSVVTFRDKPVDPFGWAQTDYCYQVKSPLTNDLNKLVDAYASLWATGGNDGPENQFGALLAAALDPQIGWTPESRSLATRLVVLSTDAPPHFSDDNMNSLGLAPYSGTFEADTTTGQCVDQYYPGPENVKEALVANEILLATLVFDAEKYYGLTWGSWKWFNDFLGQEDTFLNNLTRSGDTFWVSLSDAIKQIEQNECIFYTTPKPPTTAPPSRTVATTVVPTTPMETPTTAASTNQPTTEAPTSQPETPTSQPATTEATTPVMATTATPVKLTSTASSTMTTISTTVSIQSTGGATIPTTSTTVEPPPTVIGGGKTQTTAYEYTALETTECEEKGQPEVIIEIRHRPSELDLKVESDE